MLNHRKPDARSRPSAAFGVRLAFRGEVERARIVFERLRDRSGEFGDLRGHLSVAVQLCELALRAGDASLAGSLIDELEQWSGLVEMRTVSARLSLGLARGHARRGDRGAA